MRKLLDTAGLHEAGLLRDVLEREGIECVVRNEQTSGTLPVPAFAPELWVLDDDDVDRAIEIVTRWRAGGVPAAAWTCALCGERLEGQFAACWKCGTRRG